eukprot:TRINITY_DN1272_c0_g4_i1.p1 TRINITY_DN1272_c0_g4~~TRINITY_DN1272_c0_g4_i1.p1  ORF type:complete len:394 (+),score=184.48 TRINITY_DN1272_c0_g4_i1:2-1183(+)
MMNSMNILPSPSSSSSSSLSTLSSSASASSPSPSSSSSSSSPLLLSSSLMSSSSVNQQHRLPLYARFVDTSNTALSLSSSNSSSFSSSSSLSTSLLSSSSSLSLSSSFLSASSSTSLLSSLSSLPSSSALSRSSSSSSSLPSSSSSSLSSSSLSSSASSSSHSSVSHRSHSKMKQNPGIYGIAGLLPIIRMTDPDVTTLALGTDLTTLGLSLTTLDPLYATLSYPSSDQPARREPDYVLPHCYYIQPPTLKATHFTRFAVETLLYIFYNMPRDSLQLYAARELYTREWRYHKELRVWFLPVASLTRKTEDLTKLTQIIETTLRIQHGAVPANNPTATSLREAQCQQALTAALSNSNTYIFFDIGKWTQLLVSDKGIPSPQKLLTVEELAALFT